jgi:hypothetical protein
MRLLILSVAQYGHAPYLDIHAHGLTAQTAPEELVHHLAQTSGLMRALVFAWAFLAVGQLLAAVTEIMRRAPRFHFQNHSPQAADAEYRLTCSP